MQLLVSGLLIGGIYSLVSIGLSLIYGAMDIVNFAHGSFMMLGMYSAFWMFVLYGLDPYLSLPLIAALFLIIGWLIQSGLIQRVIGAPMVSQFTITFGLMLIIENGALAAWTTDLRAVRTSYTGLTFRIAGIAIAYPKLTAFFISIIASIILYLFLTKTFIGLAIRSTAQNREVATIVGVNTRNMFALTFGIGISLAVMAGVLLSLYYPMTPFVGITFVIIAFVVCVLGGLGNYMGAFFGGIIVGLVEGFGGFIFGPQFKQIIYLAVFFAILILRPRGLLGRGE